MTCEQPFGFDVLERMREYAVPGVSVALLTGGRITGQWCFGTRRAGSDGPAAEVVPTTRFQACSISKPVTVFGALRLVQDGELDLDADVNERLRSWSVPANGAWRPRVTLRRIASHSAGLTTSGFPGYPNGAALPTIAQVLAGVAPANSPGVRADLVPGLQFRYSGGGITVLQLMLEEASGAPVDELLDRLVLSPLGMRHSTFAQPLPPELHEQAASGHHGDGSVVAGEWHVYPEQCAAGLWTTPADLLRFAMGVRAADGGEPDAVVRPDLVAQMLTRQVPTSESYTRIGGLDSMGLGLFLRADADGRGSWFGHLGGNEGFNCHLLVHRDTGDGAAIMTNSDECGVNLIVDLLGGLAARHDWPDLVLDPIDPPLRSGLDPFVGSFALPSGARMGIERRGEELHVTIADQPPLTFFATSATELFCQAVDARLSRSDDGVVTLHQGDEEWPCREGAVTSAKGPQPPGIP
jgi:CubicO group peptidase (beta-lactamase class C family)